MVICGQEFEFSLMNANDLDRFEDANERMQRRSAEESEQFRRGGVRLGDHARAQARIAMDCIDEILGAGSSARLGLDENNMAPMHKITQKLERLVRMMAKLWAQEIMFAETMEDAKALYERCPRLLKEKVKAILIKSGFEEITQ